MRFLNCSTIRKPRWPQAATLLLASLMCYGLVYGQINVLDVAPLRKVAVPLKGTADAVVALQLRDGYHVNSNMPADAYFIPLRLTWNPGPVEPVAVVFPKPQMEKLAFSEKPVSIFTGNFEVVTKFKASAGAAPGQSVATGKLRYQACNDRMCLAPRTIDLSLPVEIVK